MLVPRVPSVGGLGFPATIYPSENRVSSDSAAPTPFIFQTIDSIGEKELDSLPYGVIQLDAQGTVLRYNSYEEGLSGLTRQKVVGKNFFKQIAPCTDMQEFYGRFREGVAAGELHCTFRYHFAFKRNPGDVTITRKAYLGFGPAHRLADADPRQQNRTPNVGPSRHPRQVVSDTCGDAV